jgi:flagellar hook-length control protein FliK
LFHSTARKALASSKPSANQSATQSAQLASLLQKGTPMATIVDRLSQQIASSAARLMAGRYSSSVIDRLRNTITQTIANALSPPSNAPPGNAASQAAALAARLQRMVESLAGDAQNESGQQSEFSGKLLDANSAKELPAQQKTTGALSPLDASVVARSLLDGVVSALGAGPNGTNAAAASAAQTNAAQTSSAQTSSAQTSAAPTPAPSPTASISMSNAPDLLARMLVRAAGADAQINGSSGVAAAASDSGDAQAAAPLSSNALAARFAAVLAEVSAGSAVSGNSPGGASTGGNTGHSFDQDLGTPALPNAAAGLASQPAGPSLLSQVENAVQGTPASSSLVDANSVIEQMVSSMVMRTAQSGTTEIRLQLQPESLGQVTMRLTVSGSQVNANVVAQSADVRSALVANHQELARSLSEAGLTLSGFSVDVSGGDAGDDQSKDHTTGFGRRFTVHELANGDASSETTDASSLGPQILSASKLELFNYLA